MAVLPGKSSFFAINVLPKRPLCKRAEELESGPKGNRLENRLMLTSEWNRSEPLENWFV